MPTKLAIEMKDLEESKRHNKAMEKEAQHARNISIFNLARNWLKDVADTVVAGVKLQDPSWYKKGAVRDSNYTYAWENPYEEQINPNGTDSGQAEIHTILNPAFCVLKWVPSIGTGYNHPIGGSVRTSPVGRAITQFFTDDRAANFAASGNYTAANYFQWILGFDSVMTAIAEAYRIYTLAQTFRDENWNIPADVITALGWNYASVRSGLPNFHARLRELVEQVNTIAVPGGMSYMEKHLLLASEIYRDQPLKKCHYFMFKCDCFFLYDELNSKLIRMNPMFSVNNTWEQNCDLISVMIAALQKGTGKTMSGDTRRWCSDLLKVEIGGEDDKFEFNDDKNMLLQIQNASVIGNLYSIDDDCEIHETPDGEDLYQGTANPAKTIAYGFRLDTTGFGPSVSNEIDTPNTLIRCYEDVPSVDTVIDATRLIVPRDFKTWINSAGTSVSSMVTLASGSEVVLTATIYFRNVNQTTLTNFEIWDYKDVNGLVGSTYGKYWNMISRFNYMPIMHLINGNGPNNSYPYYLWQSGNFVVYPFKPCADNHRLALMSQLGYYGSSKASSISSKPSKSDTPEPNPKKDWKKGKKGKK